MTFAEDLTVKSIIPRSRGIWSLRAPSLETREIGRGGIVTVPAVGWTSDSREEVPRISDFHVRSDGLVLVLVYYDHCPYAVFPDEIGIAVLHRQREIRHMAFEVEGLSEGCL